MSNPAIFYNLIEGIESAERFANVMPGSVYMWESLTNPCQYYVTTVPVNPIMARDGKVYIFYGDGLCDEYNLEHERKKTPGLELMYSNKEDYIKN